MRKFSCRISSNTTASPTNLTAVLNAGKQINQGVELESVWRPTRPLTLSLNVGYLDSYYKNFLINCAIFTFQVGCPPSGVGVLNLADENRPLNAPFWTISENTIYTWDLPSGSLLARAGVDWRSFTKVAVYTPSPTDQPAYRTAQRRPRVHHHRQGVAVLDRRQEPDRPLLPRRRLRLRASAARTRQYLHRRRQPDRLLWSATHGYRDGDLPLLKYAQRGLGQRTLRFAYDPALRAVSRTCRGSKRPRPCCRI